MIFNNVTLNGDITHSGITLAGDISHTVVSLEPIDTINYTAAKWGYIQGTLSDQTDLINLLNLKADAGSLASVATSGSYLDLTNTPTIPTKVSDLTNDSGYLTENDVAPVATSGDYSDLSNLPTIPTKTSDLTNDSGFVTSVPTKTSDLTNDSNFVSDANYVHTDSNYTLGEKGKLASIESGAEENVIEVIKVNGVTQTVTNKEVDLIISGGGNVDDVEVNGVSVVTNKIAEVTVPAKVSDLTNDSGFITGMTILSYGSSTWQDFLTAYNANKVVYCRASSNTNPAQGDKNRLAFLAYVQGEANPSRAEFQYYRSVSAHSATQQGDQVYIYTLQSSGWTVTVREAYSAVQAGTGLTRSYSNGVVTLGLSSAVVNSVNGQTGAVVISTATTSADGLMSSTDKTKLEAVYADYSSAITALGA